MMLLELTAGWRPDRGNGCSRMVKEPGGGQGIDAVRLHAYAKLC